MQDELDSQELQRPIQILGINAVGLESGNVAMTAERDLPWLQSVEEEDPWTLWPIEYRDVVILGPGNERLGTFNLTTHDLADPVNYADLLAQLRAAAD